MYKQQTLDSSLITIVPHQDEVNMSVAKDMIPLSKMTKIIAYRRFKELWRKGNTSIPYTHVGPSNTFSEMYENINDANEALFNLSANVKGTTFTANSAATSTITKATSERGGQEESYDIFVQKGFEEGRGFWRVSKPGWGWGDPWPRGPGEEIGEYRAEGLVGTLHASKGERGEVGEAAHALL